ncbi:hypothetical protein FVE85_3065 [Porphyridium purpureum]|uniref:Uncharacterized protein n=1 Tax=Porphyridium purpureum TaxID=35688 RepID=A0A5J4YVU1_PORPP|nr:hypothetical protein FVE85_3065 [Porphyridium purpureum]|eukprot:POR3759..scf227_4
MVRYKKDLIDAIDGDWDVNLYPQPSSCGELAAELDEADGDVDNDFGTCRRTFTPGILSKVVRLLERLESNCTNGTVSSLRNACTRVRGVELIGRPSGRWTRRGAGLGYRPPWITRSWPKRAGYWGSCGTQMWRRRGVRISASRSSFSR